MTNENKDKKPGVAPEAKKASIFKKINAVTYIIVVLFLAVAGLYVLHFTGTGISGRISEERLKPDPENLIGAEYARIAYINSDFLMQNYEFAIKLRANFEAERTRMENDLSRRQRSFQAEVEQFQRDVQSGMADLELAQAKERELMQRQQELLQINETFSNRLMQREVEMNQELLDKLNEFLSRYNVEYGYDYILGFTPGGGILYANTRHDITNDVLTRLNEEYLEGQENIN
ncbi:MAG TPA: OmpH family outer membrane protein [Bacteroidales bacterium]|nr:OmpH family outer membrane protein [Bacteroidales bacterium]